MVQFDHCYKCAAQLDFDSEPTSLLTDNLNEEMAWTCSVDINRCESARVSYRSSKK